MALREGVWKEAAVVGGSLVAISALVMAAARKLDPERRVPLLAWVFLTGAATHLGWEVTGGNAYFVDRYLDKQGLPPWRRDV